MFFPELIKSIKPTDQVLEIGPGGTPHVRADIFLDLIYENEETAKMQRGNYKQLSTNKPIVYFDGKNFPFADKEFDYVICSHVLEHVDDVEYFLSEIFRIAPKGYIEFPTIYYEYLYNFSVHLNLLKAKNGTLLYLKKALTHLSEFSSVQTLLLQSFEKGYTKLVDDLKCIMFEGFEWLEPFSVIKASLIEDLTFDDFIIPCYKESIQVPAQRNLAFTLIQESINFFLNRKR